MTNETNTTMSVQHVTLEMLYDFMKETMSYNQTRFSDIDRQLENFRFDVYRQFDDIRNNIDDIRDNIKDIKTELKSLDNRVANLDNRVANMENQKEKVTLKFTRRFVFNSSLYYLFMILFGSVVLEMVSKVIK